MASIVTAPEAELHLPGFVPSGRRGVDLRDRPAVSVVVASTRDRHALEARLTALLPKAARHEAEVVVARPAALGDLAGLAEAFPAVRFVACPAGSGVSDRARGLAGATGAVVILTDDAAATHPEWLDFEAVGPKPDGAPEGPDRPLVSVIVPAHQAVGVLAQSLEALRRSDLDRDRWELVVVDDASLDATELVAAEYADVIVRLAGNPHGPAYARNRGAEVSRGDVLVFVDADVTVHPDAVRLLATHLSRPEGPAAVFGSYDVNPSHASLVSQYRNLLHHFVHQQNAGPAETFWSGLGAVRAGVFSEIGMFDEWHYSRPQIEDIELGRRLRGEGHTVLLDPRIQGTHLKRWTFRSVLATDFQHRGVPWMWLLLQEGSDGRRHGLSVGRREQFCTALVALAAATLVGAAVFRLTWPLMVSAAVAAMAGLLNLPFYRYLRRRRSLRFTLGVLPLHLSYYLTNVLAVGTGWLVHQLFGAPQPPPARQAAAQVGLKSWPPPIRRPTQSIWTTSGTRKALARRASPPAPPAGEPAPSASASVVVASCRHRALLDACLAALRPQCARHGATLIVARAVASQDELDALRLVYPEVRFVAGTATATIPELRGLGLAQAAGEIAALTEDHCIPDDNWLGRLLAASAGFDVVGGSMGNARRERSLDWGAYFAEYGFFATAAPDTAAPAVTGANVAYRRRVLERVAALYRTGEWEDIVHACLVTSGSKVTFVPAAAVLQNDTYRFREFCRNRFRHGRDYARRRLVDEPSIRRWLLLAGSPILPVILTARVAGAAASVNRPAFVRALPFTVAFLAAWAVGEAVGYALGRASGPAPEPQPGTPKPLGVEISP